MASFSVPKPLAAFNSKFPLKTYPPIRPTAKNLLTRPTLWIAPPKEGNLSNDVECLKWQSYIALRGVKGVELRYDVAVEGCLDGVLPNLHVPLAESSLKNVPEVSRQDGREDGELLPAHGIPVWADTKLGVDSALDPLEGYVNEAARVESRAWVSLLEGVVHAALVCVYSVPSITPVPRTESLLDSFPTSTVDILFPVISFRETTIQRKFTEDSVAASCIADGIVFIHPTSRYAPEHDCHPLPISGRDFRPLRAAGDRYVVFGVEVHLLSTL